MSNRTNSEILTEAGEAALAGDNEPVDKITEDCGAAKKVIPIVFVPGIMGSRLKFSTGKKWDPDDSTAMSYWVFLGAESKRTQWHYKQSAEVITDSDGCTAEERTSGYQTTSIGSLPIDCLTKDELRRGYAGVARDFYLKILRYLSGSSFKLGVETPVYAVGYDWRQSNYTSGEFLLGEVKRILKDEGASEAVIVSHSMGGLVSRAAMKIEEEQNRNKPGLGKSVFWGAVHIFQPTHGAVVMYRRYFTGAQIGPDGDILITSILGNDPDKWANVTSGLRGPLELLPTNGYRDSGDKPWLKHKKVKLLFSPPRISSPPSVHAAAAPDYGTWDGDVYELYRGSLYPPAVLDFGNRPKDVKQAAATDLSINIRLAKGFHSWLGLFQHERTRSIYSNGEKTDMAILFESTLGADAKPKFQPVGPPIGWEIIYPDIAQSRTQGDGTVPLTSASALSPASEVLGVKHADGCNKDAVQQQVRKHLKDLLSRWPLS